MAILQRTPAPLSTPISEVDQKTGKYTGYLPTAWADYFVGLDAQLAQTFAFVDRVSIPSSSAAVGSQPITNRILNAGLYRVSYYAVILQADNVGSSLQPFFYWIDRGTLRSFSDPAYTTNVVTFAATKTYFVRIDRATPISYQVNYGSTGGAPKMIYSLDIAVEQVTSLP